MASSRAAESRFVPALTGWGTLVAALLIIEALIASGFINAFVVPKPSQVLAAIPRIVTEEDVAHRFGQTALEVLWASLMLTVIGLGMGMLLYRFALLRRATETWVAALASAPIVLMYPLFLVIFGRSPTTIVMIGFAAGLPPVILKTVEGLAGTRSVLVNVGRSFRLTNTQLFHKILLPAALPSIFVGLRLGLIFAMINIVGVEFLINFGGLGQLINELAERYDLPGTYGAILFVILVSVLFFYLTGRAEQWLRRGT
ncbi:MAG: ABC transporter permease subunit [Pseudomonadota bacterium]|nr:ABC transporter permease subunit [Pseudomonadota bacterium]